MVVIFHLEMMRDADGEGTVYGGDVASALQLKSRIYEQQV